MVLRMFTLNLLKICMYKTALSHPIIFNKITYFKSCKQQVSADQIPPHYHQIAHLNRVPKTQTQFRCSSNTQLAWNCADTAIGIRASWQWQCVAASQWAFIVRPFHYCGRYLCVHFHDQTWSLPSVYSVCNVLRREMTPLSLSLCSVSVSTASCRR
jgi:hypothetical protein